MAVDSTAWFVGGGAQHSPEVARLLAYAATSGAEGVIEPHSLRVAAQSVPSGSVRVLPGAALILNRYAGGGQQTYALRNPTSTTVTIPATGSTGGRTDMIVARVLDPQYEGQPPADPLTFQYARIERISGVSSSAKTAAQLNLGYPAVALARVTLPASTATVTAGMITNLREVANPRTLEVWRPRPLTASDAETLTSTAATGEIFPDDGGGQLIDIPHWATRVQIRAEWIAVQHPAGDSRGRCWVEFGPYSSASVREFSTQDFGFDSPNSADAKRMTWLVTDDRAVPESIRGTSQIFLYKAKLLSSSSNAARPTLDSVSGVSLMVRFLEEADPSTT